MVSEIALVGHELIHTYPYIVHLNGSTREKIDKNAKPWMKRFMLEQDLTPKTDELRVTRIWSPDDEENKKLAETFSIDSICGSVEEALDGAQCAMVMDENNESRTVLIKACIEAGLSVFATKVLSTEPAKVDELFQAAKKKNVRVHGWSQLYFDPGIQRIRDLPGGGVAFLSFGLPMKKLSIYGIHMISMVQGAFKARMKSYRPLTAGEDRSGLIELDDGTRIFLYMGENVSSRSRLYYNEKDHEAIFDDRDEWSCFSTAANAVMALFTGKDVPGPGPAEMKDAAMMLECLIDEKADGQPVPLG